MGDGESHPPSAKMIPPSGGTDEKKNSFPWPAQIAEFATAEGLNVGPAIGHKISLIKSID